ncbi:MAG: hypothetical protein KYX67_06085 [Brevundimonas sp.]|uniref:hypothetical protein n=1 Tax=Brevundimonas sp. TaxID=1871086 RepID=UPI00255D812E|nr:hypothetical protein [Brevundimonas sp.]MDK2746866.1 hypothetical protein [Brevundimonas sp.]
MLVDAVRDEPALLAGAADLTGQSCANRADAFQALRAARATVGRAVFDTAPVALAENHVDLKRDVADRLAALQSASVAVDDAVAAVSAATAASYSAALLRFWSEGLAIAGDQTDCPMCEAPTLSDASKAVLRNRIAASEELVTATDIVHGRLVRDYNALYTELERGRAIFERLFLNLVGCHKCDLPGYPHLIFYDDAAAVGGGAEA